MMSPNKRTTLAYSDKESNSGSDSETSRSRSVSPAVSVNQDPVPTPGYSLDQQSRSNSPQSALHSPASRSVSQSPASHRSNSPNQSAEQSSPARSEANDSPARSDVHDSRSNSPNLQIDAASQKGSASPSSQRSGSRNSSKASSPANSRHSGSRRSRSKSHSLSPASPSSHKSGSHSPAHSIGSHKSHTSNRSRSRSQSQSVKSVRSDVSAGSRARSGSAHSNRSRSQSPAESHTSNKSGKSDKSKDGRDQHMSDDSDVDIRSRKNRNLSDDSGSDTKKVSKKTKSGVIESDSSDGEEKEKDETVTADALFGDADDISSEEEREKKSDKRDSDSESDRQVDSDHDERARSDDERRRTSDEEDHQQTQRVTTLEDYEDPEQEQEPIPETRIDVEIPKISIDLGRELHFVKLPNFLSVEPRPFDKETYEDEIDEEETLDEEGRARLKLKVENTIRWREVFDKDGNVVKESNARFIRWSDGSLSLHLGSEIFDVYKQPLQGDHNHLFIRQGTGLQGQAVFRNKLTFRPHSTESFTHRKMTMSLADRSQKTTGIKILSQVGHDPDQDRKWNLKKEEEKLRQAMRSSRPTSKPKRSRDSAAHASFREDEGSEDEGAISIAAIKNKFNKPKNGAQGPTKSGGAIYSSDEDGSDFEARKAKKTDKTKALQDSDEGSGSESIDDDGSIKSDAGNDSNKSQDDDDDDDDDE